MPKRALVCSLLLVPVLVLAQGKGPRNMYRYINRDGATVVDYQVPPEYVAGGYEVLDREGLVISVVPPQLTESERAAHKEQRVREEEARAEAKRLREWDESLLLRYSTLADIEDARERALRELRIRVNILKSNQRSLKKLVETYQTQAADIERSGQQVDMERLKVIDDLQAEIAAVDRAIADRRREMDEVSELFQKDLDRFEQLLELVQLRRQLLVRQREESAQSVATTPATPVSTSE